MANPPHDVWWGAFVDALLRFGPIDERSSRYGDKPAVFLDGHEIAHREAPDVIDLRITATGWAQIKRQYSEDPAVKRDPGRRDWIELHLSDVNDLDRLGSLLAVAVAANM